MRRGGPSPSRWGGDQWADHGEIVGSILQRGGCRWRGSRRTQRWRPGGSDPSTGIVIGYIASVLMSVGILLTLLKNGW
jgi:hypothetical protein